MSFIVEFLQISASCLPVEDRIIIFWCFYVNFGRSVLSPTRRVIDDSGNDLLLVVSHTKQFELTSREISPQIG